MPSPCARTGEGTPLLAVLSALVVAGCWGAEPSEFCAGANRAGYVGCVEGVSIVVAPRVASPPDTALLVAQVERAIDVGAETWGVARTTWNGWIVEVREEWVHCPTSAGSAWAWGCAYPDRKLIQASPSGDGCALGVLVHELGHAAGWSDHFSPDGTYLFHDADLRASEICEGLGDEEDGAPHEDDDAEDEDEEGEDEDREDEDRERGDDS